MERDIIKIDEDKCNGCGDCVPNCHEGALQIIDGKVRLISDLFCDGLGACLGHCPEGALEIEKREAEAYDEVKVIKDMIPKGKNVIIAHLKHLKDHNETLFVQQAIKYLEENKNELGFDFLEVKYAIMDEKKKKEVNAPSGCGCPGSKEMIFNKEDSSCCNEEVSVKSELRQWPIQMHLVNPQASYFQNSDLVFAADCAAFSMGDFHSKYLKGKAIAIACPKLDSGQDVYEQKLISMIDDANVNTITIARMQVPCCGGLQLLVERALEKAERKVPVKIAIISFQGEVLSEEWM